MADRPPTWPPGVERMDLQSLNRLGTDSAHRLYWDGKRIRTQLTLSLPQTILATLAALASLATIFTGLNNASTFLCARGVTLLGCPASPASPPASPARAP